MKLQLLALSVLLCTTTAMSMSLVEPPEAGITNQELERLGDKADKELARRFSNPSNAKFRAGLLIRMGAFGNLSRPSPEIMNVAKAFVEREVRECSGVVPLDRKETIGGALQIIGQRGGKPGLKYLEGWVYDPKVFGRINCSVGLPKEQERTQSQLRRDALWGIGRNGTKRSLDLLLKIARDRPPDKYSGSFMGVLNEAISENRLILKEGVDRHFKTDRRFFVRRVEER